MTLCRIIDSRGHEVYDIYDDEINNRCVGAHGGGINALKSSVKDYLRYLAFNNFNVVAVGNPTPYFYEAVSIEPLFEVTFPIDIEYYKEKYPEEFI